MKELTLKTNLIGVTIVRNVFTCPLPLKDMYVLRLEGKALDMSNFQ
jgi:hypothetical protein